MPPIHPPTYPPSPAWFSAIHQSSIINPPFLTLRLDPRFRLGSLLKFIIHHSAFILFFAASGCGDPSASAPGTGTPADPSATAAALPPVGIWQDEDPYLRGYDALAEAVADLSTNIRVLHTGAHPDDENSDLMAYLARGRHFRTAYLSATRGEGGQNGIGPETGEALGVIRTEELLAARRIDGAEQYFLSAPDFGFSKSAAETLKIWGEEKTLKELVHFIRWYRPQVIVSVFSGTPFDGHGHHQAIGQLTREAFDAAADPAFKDDLPPWTTQLLFQSLWRDPGEEKLPGQRFTIDTGQYDALLGKTYHQIAMDGRSQHRSQDMGAAQDPGPHPITLRLWSTSKQFHNPDKIEEPFGPTLDPFPDSLTSTQLTDLLTL
ncbi:MAG TPA: PIG-L family deacetylase, partial [Planctomycetota bacterium]|nr:PIG-L family deacetylase [Planctomycetota bacterium]